MTTPKRVCSLWCPGLSRLCLFWLFVATVFVGHAAPVSGADKADVRVPKLLKQIGVNRGFCVVLGDRSGRLAVELAKRSELTLFVQSPRADDVSAIRRTVSAAGLLGTRVYVAPGAWSRIHLATNLADAVVLTGSAAKRSVVGRSEVLRVLHPGGKLIDSEGITVKPLPAGSGDWSHPYHGPDNNPQADDRIAKAPYLTQFLATPYYGPMPEVTVSAGGRLFKAFGHISFKKREWAMLSKLVALNAYNGAKLWERKLTPGFMIHRNTMVATPGTLYLADNTSCKMIDTATGRITDEIVLPKGLADGPVWKWMAMQNGILYALVGEQEQIDDVQFGTRTRSGWPWNRLGKGYARKDYPWGFGRTLVAIDPTTKKILWSRRWKDKIDSRALSLSSGRLFIYSERKFLAAVDIRNGKTLWKTDASELLRSIGETGHAQTPRLGYASTVYTKATGKVLLFAGPQRKKLVAVSAENGRMLWYYPKGNFQLVVRDDGLYAMGRTSTSHKFDLMSGKVLANLECFRGNCTRATGSVDAIFARGHSHMGTLRYDVAAQRPGRIPAMRPACQDGVVIANGLMYWGPWMCDCNHSLVGIVSLGPAGDFDFSQAGTDKERLQTATGDLQRVAEFSTSKRDWPTYRTSNRRTADTSVSVPKQPRPVWTSRPPRTMRQTAPVAAGGLVLFGGADGIVRAIDAASGQPRWTAYTAGPIKYPPTIWQGRVYVGSADGWIYAFEAATGRSLWRFRAAPIERIIPVYGSLSSTWPVASGVLVADGVAYAAAGIASHDGTHVYALDAITGKIKWQNNTSGHLLKKEVFAGVSVQGHLLLDGDRLYLAGGNVVSPAIYDIRTGRCLSTLTDVWKQRAPRGSELFLAAGKVRVVDTLLYSPRNYIPSRYYGKYLLEASEGDTVIQGTERSMMRISLKGGPNGKPKLIWRNSRFSQTSAVVLCGNGVLVAGRLKGPTPDAPPKNVLTLLNREDGTEVWSRSLPVPAESWGLAVDRDGRILVTLSDGRVVCYAK